MASKKMDEPKSDTEIDKEYDETLSSSNMGFEGSDEETVPKEIYDDFSPVEYKRSEPSENLKKDHTNLIYNMNKLSINHAKSIKRCFREDVLEGGNKIPKEVPCEDLPRRYVLTLVNKRDTRKNFLTELYIIYTIIDKVITMKFYSHEDVDTTEYEEIVDIVESLNEDSPLEIPFVQVSSLSYKCNGFPIISINRMKNDYDYLIELVHVLENPFKEYDKFNENIENIM